MTNDQAQRKAVRLWGYRGATIAPRHEMYGVRIAFPLPVYEVGRLYYPTKDSARFVPYGAGTTWERAFAAAKRAGKVK